jgi:hypothetical protein
VLWSVCRFTRRSALLGTVHKMELRIRVLGVWTLELTGMGTLFLYSSANVFVKNVRYYKYLVSSPYLTWQALSPFQTCFRV